MSRREYEGRSAAEAAIKACDELDLPRSALRYEVVSETGEPPLNRRVVIAVNIEASKAAHAEAPPEPERRERGGFERHGREGRGHDRGREGRGHESRGRERGREGRESRESHDEGRARRGRRGGRGDERREPRARVRRDEEPGFEGLFDIEAVPAEPFERRPEIQGEPSARAAAAREVLVELLHLADLHVTPRLVEDAVEEIHFDLAGDDEARVIGRKGETLLALQFLINRIVARQDGSDAHVVLDAANYRARRREVLADMARKLAARALEEKKVVRLSPMSAHDRRIVHMTLKEHDGVTTRSEGEGLFRSLLIVPNA